MATFNQQNQTVGYQVNGENMTIIQGPEALGSHRATIHQGPSLPDDRRYRSTPLYVAAET